MSYKITFLGHATTLITLSSGEKIIIDPWLEGNPSCPEQYRGISDINLICLTHGHSDHTGSAVALAQRSKARVCATYELGSLLVIDGVPESQILFMNKGGSITLSDLANIKVTLTNAFHSSSYCARDGITYYAGEACGVVITLDDKRAIYHAGDTCLFSDMRLIRELYQPEVAILPIGDRFTMCPKEAALATKIIQPRFVIPVHWGTFPLLTGTPEELQRELAGLDCQMVKLNPGEEREF